jgi:tetratricopeptide (TPR) repeat protein
MIALVNYGAELTEAGRLAEGQARLREAVTLAERQRGPDHDDVALALQPLAMNLLFSKSLDEALAVARRGAAIMAKNRGALNPATLAAERAVMSILVERGRCPEAIRLADTVIAARGPELPDTDLSLGSAYLIRGQCLGQAGRWAEAEGALKEGLALRLATLPPAHWAVGQAQSLLGEVAVRSGRKAEGLRLLEQGVAGIEAGLGPANHRAIEARQRLDRYR